MGGGGSSVSGSSNQWTSGVYGNESTQTPIFPKELDYLRKQMASNLSQVQQAAPIQGGGVSYGSQIPNQAYADWVQQYGQYNKPQGGMWYSLGEPVMPDYNYWYYTQNPESPTGGVYNASTDPWQETPWAWSQIDPSTGKNAYGIAPTNWGGQISQIVNVPAPPPGSIGDWSTAQPSINFLSPQAQQIVPLSELEQQAAALTPEIWNMPEAEQLAMQYAGGAGNVPTNEPYYGPGAFEMSPYYKSAYGAYQSGVVPTIENQMALSGLGRSSSMMDALATGWAGIVPQVLSQYSTQYVEPQLGREENALARQAALVPSLAGIGAQDTARMTQAINAMMAGGGLGRSVEQTALDAMYADMLRQQALAEEALYTPMGMLFPSAIGQNLVSSGTYSSQTAGNTSQRSSGGGLFK